MDYVKRVYSQPTISSLKEGEEVVYLGRSKPLARYRKENGQIWISYMTTNGDLFVEKDFNVQGTISQGGTGGGGGGGEPIVKNGIVMQTAGGVGISTVNTTGAVSFNSGTPSINTLPASIGGTGQNLSSSTGAISVNSGTVSAGTLAISNGGTAATTASGAKSALSAATTFRQNGIPTALAAGDIWIDTDANNKQYRATSTGDDAITSGEWEEVTIEAKGMDAIAGTTIYNDSNTSRAELDDDTIPATYVFYQSGTTDVIKVAFNYFHEEANKSMKLSCLLLSSDASDTAYARLAIYPLTVSGSLTTGSTPNTASASAGPVTISTTKTAFDGTHTSSALDISGLTNNTLYKVCVLLDNSDASTLTKMTAPTVTVYGS